MQNHYYSCTVPVFIKTLGGVKNSISKARDLSATLPGGETEILSASLAPDMFPFVRQVQIVTDNAKGAAARLAGIDIPSYADDEASLDALGARIDKTIAFLETLTPEQFAQAESVKVELPYFPGKHMLAEGYLSEYALPNFFFHAATVYNIVRMKGGALGKGDYLNGIPLQDN